MFVVALMELAGEIDREAAALAADLGTTLYEERLRLLTGTPAIVLATTDEARARTLLGQVRRRGHGVVACDTRAVVSSAEMIAIRQFALEEDAIALDGGPEARLPADDIVAFVRAQVRTQIETREEVKGRKFSLGRAVLTGGLVATKTVSREQRTTSSEAQQALYVFRASGAVPWILFERGANYAALGAERAASAAQNFATAVTKLRRLAPHAAYDERFVSRRPARTPAVSSDAAAVDLAAHLLALWFARQARGTLE